MMGARPRTGGPPLAASPQEEPDAEDRSSDDARRGHSRRQVRRPVGERLHDRHPGAGKAADDPALAGQGGRARHGLHDLGLPRLAARQFRPGVVAGAAVPGEARRALPTRRQRGYGGHRALGHAAGGALPRCQARGRLCHLVRQGAGCRPHDGRLQACQQRRHGAPRRRARAGRRRPRLRLVDDGASERVRLHERGHAGDQPGGRPGVSGLRAARLGALALRRPLGRLHLHRRDGGQLRNRLGRPPPGSPSSRRKTTCCPQAGSTSACPTRRSSRRSAFSNTSSTPRAPMAGRTGSTAP